MNRLEEAGTHIPETTPATNVGFSSIVRTYRRGPASLFNLSLYSFGLSAMATGIGSGILPFKVLDVLDSGAVVVFGNDLDKNGTLGLISLIGLACAAVMQPASGVMSDRSLKSTGKRLPFIAVGAVLMAVSAYFFGAANTFLSVLLATILIQLSGNLSQGPANALLVDHIERQRLGRAAGALNLFKVMGAGIFTYIILRFMAQYDREEASEWMWYALALLSAVLIITSLWTVFSLRNRPSGEDGPEHVEPAERHERDARPFNLDKVTYGWFLFALAFVIAAMSSMQVYALFFLQDVVGIENPAEEASWLVVAVGLSTAATVLPAGYIADRIGRSAILIVGGGLGALGAAILLFAESFTVVLLDGVLIGCSVGIMLSVTWTVANDMVSGRRAARDLGLTGIAMLVGSALARVAGVGIDALNHRSDGLGYQVMLISICIAFVVAAIMLAVVAGKAPGTADRTD